MTDTRLKELQKKYGILGKSDDIREVMEIIDQVAGTDITVLIAGESGTGKELIADAIHRHSLRKHEKFIKVNCGAIPAGILESELFGHVKGAFTGAIEDRKGYFETADGGTIFLDEIGEMPAETQVKLLRVLELGEFLPVGGSRSRQVDVRIIAATNKNLEEEVNKDDGFRKDLYYRLKTITIYAPPLRKHPEDIPELVKKFALDFANRNNISFKGFSPNAMEMLKDYAWPGNVRELKNFVESMIVLQKGEIINSKMVAKQLKMSRGASESSPNLPVSVSPQKRADQAERELILHQIFMLRRDLNELRNIIVGQTPAEEYQKKSHLAIQKYEPPVFEDEKYYEPTEETPAESNAATADEQIINRDKLGNVSLEEVERDLIEGTLEKFDYKKRQTANALKISERTLYRKIKEYGLQNK